MKLCRDENLEPIPDQAALFLALQQGHIAILQLLLECGVDIEAKNKYGQTPLSWAAENGHEAVVRVLLGQGGNIEATDGYGRTPLSRAAGNGYETVVQLLRQYSQ